MYKGPQKILSDNSKCGCSINMPIKGHCCPTEHCKHDCYARTGHTAMPAPVRKQKWVSNYLKQKDISRLINECIGRSAVRLNGTGDLLKEHLPQILSLAKACPNTQFWGMTRKPEIAKALNNKLPNLKLLVTVDSSSPQSVWNYDGKLCYGPRRPDDIVPDDPRIITVFPRHFAGRVVNGVPRHPKDCKAVWHEIPGCLHCGRCWNFKPN